MAIGAAAAPDDSRRVERLEEPCTLVRTQVTTPTGRYVDMEIWLRSKRLADTAGDVVLWPTKPKKPWPGSANTRMRG